jgi:hypothetical protein
LKLKIESEESELRRRWTYIWSGFRPATVETLSSVSVTKLTMQDELGIVYLIYTAQQFWSGTLLLLMLGPYSNHAVELEDILDLPDDEAPTLSLLDATLRRSLVLCATYHGTSQRFHREALN